MIMNDINRGLYNAPAQAKEKISRLLVYPNPTNDVVNITYNCYALQNGTFTLYDVLGRAVLVKTLSPQQAGVQQFNIGTEALNAGTYFYTLQIGQQSYNGKVLKISN